MPTSSGLVGLSELARQGIDDAEAPSLTDSGAKKNAPPIG